MEIAKLSHKEEEHYKQRGPRSGVPDSKQVDNYTLYFENKQSFCLPKDNYLWSEERPMSDFAIFQVAQRGEEFYLAINTITGNIDMIYPLEFFEYKN